MILRLLRYLILFLVLCNMMTYMLVYFGETAGSLTSYATSLLLIAYFVFAKKDQKLPLPFIVLGLLYFLISSINYTYTDVDNYFIKELIRFMIAVVCGAEVVRNTNKKELFFIFLLGGISVLVHAFLFPTSHPLFYPTYGRYSGFYLNPNFAGQISLIGFAISFSISNRSWSLIGKFIFTLAGILTFSRTFIVIWIIINLLAIVQSKRNILVPTIGAVGLIIVFMFSESMNLNKQRFSALQSFFGTEQVKTKVITKDSRAETWAMYYDMILDKPLVGNGFLKFIAKYNGLPGVHNSFLMVIGEAGILPFLWMLGIYGYLLAKSFTFFKIRPELFYISLGIVLSLMTGHQYFKVFYYVFLSMFVYYKLNELSLEENSTLTLPKYKQLS